MCVCGVGGGVSLIKLSYLLNYSNRQARVNSVDPDQTPQSNFTHTDRQKSGLDEERYSVRSMNIFLVNALF